MTSIIKTVAIISILALAFAIGYSAPVSNVSASFTRDTSSNNWWNPLAHKNSNYDNDFSDIGTFLENCVEVDQPGIPPYFLNPDEAHISWYAWHEWTPGSPPIPGKDELWLDLPQGGSMDESDWSYWRQYERKGQIMASALSVGESYTLVVNEEAGFLFTGEVDLSAWPATTGFVRVRVYSYGMGGAPMYAMEQVTGIPGQFVAEFKEDYKKSQFSLKFTATGLTSNFNYPTRPMQVVTRCQLTGEDGPAPDPDLARIFARAKNINAHHYATFTVSP